MSGKEQPEQPVPSEYLAFKNLLRQVVKPQPRPVSAPVVRPDKG
jgi:hypothetical protein